MREKCKSLYDRYSFTEEEVSAIEKMTQAQAECSAWHEHRVGRITASKVYDVLRTDPTSPSISLLNSLTQTSFNKHRTSLPSLSWGIENEANALEVVRQVYSGQHSNFSLVKCGLFLNPRYKYHGASPDGIASCDCCDKKIVEAKCPYSYRDIEDITTVMKNFLNDEMSIRKEHKYYAQIQAQLAVCDVTKCVFVCFSPKGGSIIVEVMFDSDWFNERENRLRLFLLNMSCLF